MSSKDFLLLFLPLSDWSLTMRLKACFSIINISMKFSMSYPCASELKKKPLISWVMTASIFAGQWKLAHAKKKKTKKNPHEIWKPLQKWVAPLWWRSITSPINHHAKQSQMVKYVMISIAYIMNKSKSEQKCHSESTQNL